jgi:predicted nucleic acid-binding Zn ribbon protein
MSKTKLPTAKMSTLTNLTLPNLPYLLYIGCLLIPPAGLTWLVETSSTMSWKCQQCHENVDNVMKMSTMSWKCRQCHENVDNVMKMSTMSWKCRQCHENVDNVMKMSTMSRKCRQCHENVDNVMKMSIFWLPVIWISILKRCTSFGSLHGSVILVS